jgi:hypothetical protein
VIISNIVGGLGNQMFQYAAGRALSLSKGSSHLLDISAFCNYLLHQGFELQRVFACPIQIASVSDVRNILGWQYSPFAQRVLARPALSLFRRKGLVIEPHLHYWSGINEVSDDCYLLGYWQSEKYFSDVAQVIRSDFTFKTPFDPRNAELAAQIGDVNAISLHVRRGDYVNNPKTSANHGLCSLDYYHSAIQYVVERVEQPNFFIISDDPVWVKENLKMDFPCCYVDHNHGAESYNDMRLMSLCKHHVIANSSFSWWGAWLGGNPEKLVVAPRRWFRNKNVDTHDLYC